MARPNLQLTHSLATRPFSLRSPWQMFVYIYFCMVFIILSSYTVAQWESLRNWLLRWFNCHFDDLMVFCVWNKFPVDNWICFYHSWTKCFSTPQMTATVFIQILISIICSFIFSLTQKNIINFNLNSIQFVSNQNQSEVVDDALVAIRS